MSAPVRESYKGLTAEAHEQVIVVHSFLPANYLRQMGAGTMLAKHGDASHASADTLDSLMKWHLQQKHLGKAQEMFSLVTNL